MAHNPCSLMGIPDAHSDFLSHIYVDYKRETTSYDMELLGTITQGQMILVMFRLLATGFSLRIWRLLSVRNIYVHWRAFSGN